MLNRNPQARSGLKACRGCGDIAIPVLAPTPGRDRVTNGTHLPNPQIPDFAASNYYTSAALSPRKRQDWSEFGNVPFSCQNGVKWCQVAKARTPRPRLALFLTQPDCSQHVCMSCMVGATNGASISVKKQIGHIGGGPIVGTTSTAVQKLTFLNSGSPRHNKK